jgi:hypothetical protein
VAEELLDRAHPCSPTEKVGRVAVPQPARMHSSPEEGSTSNYSNSANSLMPMPVAHGTST